MKVLFTGFSPNITKRDVMIALHYMMPWKWHQLRAGEYPERVQNILKSFFSVSHAAVFDSGRTALYIALKALGVGRGDEVLVQAYTCVVVINAIQWTGARPVYVDIADDYTMNPGLLEKKISERTKAIIVQHTFGLPAGISEILELAKAKKLAVIEDCAHVFGGRVQGRLLGTFGHIGMFSFGSDKAISCVRGGALITSNPEIGKQIRVLQQELPVFSLSQTLRHVAHLPLFWLGRSWYGYGAGKWLLFFARKLRLTNNIIEAVEKRGGKPHHIPARMPNVLADILVRQISDAEDVNNHRKIIAAVYRREVTASSAIHPSEPKDSIPLRYTMQVPDPQKLKTACKRRGIMLGDWYDTVIAPRDIDMNASGYVAGQAPHAEMMASHSVNLPTNRHISADDAKRIAACVNSYV